MVTSDLSSASRKQTSEEVATISELPVIIMAWAKASRKRLRFMNGIVWVAWSGKGGRSWGKGHRELRV
jgi:hypothetical protein